MLEYLSKFVEFQTYSHHTDTANY